MGSKVKVLNFVEANGYLQPNFITTGLVTLHSLDQDKTENETKK